jgi:hypothetical protein
VTKLSVSLCRFRAPLYAARHATAAAARCTPAEVPGPFARLSPGAQTQTRHCILEPGCTVGLCHNGVPRQPLTSWAAYLFCFGGCCAAAGLSLSTPASQPLGYVFVLLWPLLLLVAGRHAFWAGSSHSRCRAVTVSSSPKFVFGRLVVIVVIGHHHLRQAAAAPQRPGVSSQPSERGGCAVHVQSHIQGQRLGTLAQQARQALLAAAS